MKVLSIAFTFLFILAGCGVQNQEINNEKDNMVQVKNSTIEEVDRDTGQDISRHLVELATGVPKVHDATAVVLGRYAIVGIDVDSNIDRSQVGSIKYSVAEALKDDPHGARAVVVADPDLNARLREIAGDIENGNPIQGIMNELSDITGRLIPEVPADMIEPNVNNDTEEPKNGLNQNEKQQLEKEQEDQSKHQK